MDIPGFKLSFSEAERREISARIDKCLATGMVAAGRNVEELEQAFAGYTDTTHVLSMSSGSAALESVMRALDVAGSTVIVPTNTYMATAASVIMAGGRVKFVDIDPTTFSPSITALDDALTDECAGVIIVHIGGIVSPDIEKVAQWCRSHGLWLVEDAAHAHGSLMNGKAPGHFGIAATYSFFSTKVVTSGEGGMVVTGSGELAERLQMLRNHGKPEPWVSHHVALGTNYRLNEIAAAVAVVHLAGLDERVSMRAAIADRYTELLSAVPEVVPVLPKDRSSWYKYIVLLPQGSDREQVRSSMRAKDVGLSGGVYDTPLHRQPVFSIEATNDLPNAEDVCARHICLPIYPGLSDEQIGCVVDSLAIALGGG